MAGRVQDKVAIITGGASGIGRQTVLRFLQEGAKVVIADRNPTGAQETLALAREHSPEVTFIAVNVAESQEVRNMVAHAVDRFDRLDVLVNAAAVLIRTPLLADVGEREWDLVMNTNLRGMFLCCKYAIPAMLQSGGGSIVNIASLAGLRGFGLSLPYAVSKAGVIHLTASAASQYTPQGIRINAVAPGPVDTPQMRGSIGSSEAFREREASSPMKRAGRPEEIANAILFLASDEASYVSGSTFVVDGGTTAAVK